ncbi:M24 family metallopeptidase [Streptosporangium roseum]|uniref:Peptidase M24 n=1 Tax=Streptosporangium roseum (strain ATCC 12428 / DSM 43021 / JCM 3005 / KCTC 9067 / NCIMB 10171 / NRRL 2505 / NI 9100) TaxID=479432 RepID=D2BBP6_STRRD|nr:Xaa-Pro peptidase family protein [Streptosporangium roseum]ACZ86115.1 peptidase M24 [Streptosporangium roseum DSM 43021]
MRLSSDYYADVHSSLRDALDQDGLDGFLATSPSDVAYLAGFFYAVTERPVYLWFPRDGRPLCVVPKLDEEYAALQRIEADVVTYAEFPGVDPAEAVLAREIGRTGRPAARIGISGGLSLAGHRALTEALGTAGLRTSPVVSNLRLIKHPEELAWHRQAAGICDEMLAAGRALIEDALRAGRPLPSEGDLARHVIGYGSDAMYQRYDHVIYTTKLAGGLVYAGPNSANPHGLPSRRRLEIGDTVILSLGAAVGSRFVESERTFVIGEPSADQRRYFAVAAEAQEVGTAGLRAGRTCAEVNRECLDVIRGHGLGEHIRHRQGHGIGVQQHEPPWVEDGDDTVLRAGMLLSSEPGVYVPGHGGYRISDTVLVTDAGPERLTSYPRGLEENVIAP